MYRKAFFLAALLALLLTACRINNPPVINQFTVTPSGGIAPLIVTITTSASDPDGDVLNCTIDFGDGSSKQVVACSASKVEHTYPAGSYTITYAVSDGRGGNVSRNASVNVSPLTGACPQPSTLSLSLQSLNDEKEPEGIGKFAGLAYEPGELIVYAPELSLQSMEVAKLEAELAIQKVADLRLGGWKIYRVPAGQEEEIARELIAAGLGRYAQPNYKYKLLYTPNDTYYNTTHSTGSQALQYGFMHVEDAWDELLTGGCRPVVGVIDSGVADDHPDLDENVISGYDFSDNDSDPYPEAGSDHGTMVASIIGAETDNNQGMAGVSNNLAYIMPLKVFPNAYSTTIADAIDWAVDSGANILNMSLCITDSSGACADLTSSPDSAIEAALQRAYNAGVISLAASGNYDDNFVGYPASSQYTIAVGATDNNNPPQRADSGDWGPDSGSNYGQDLDVVAPGTDVLGAGIPTTSDPETYFFGAGTSFATPYAAGVMALYVSQYYAYKSGSALPSAATATNCIRAAAEDLGAADFDVYTGTGMVRADHMLDTANNIYGCY